MRLSVVVPTFREALHIEDTVSAALCIGDEVIVADSGSADETAERAYNRVHLGWSVLPGNADVERVVCVHR